MKVAIITTLNHNVGDDFVREGIKYLLKQYFKNKIIEFQNIHKHSPITVRHGFEHIRSLRISRILDKLIPKNWTKDKILEADIVVQSGAPVYWCHSETHCYNNEWYKPLIKERFLKNKKAKLLNLAAGSCQTYHSDGSEFCEKCKAYIKEFYNLSTVTTVRDKLAQIILSKLDIDVPVIPCSSIFAVDMYNLKSSGEEYIVVNFMKKGGHYKFGQPIDEDKWESEFKKFYFHLKEKEKEMVIFSCHNQKEVYEALKIDPQAKIFYAGNDYFKYMEFYSKAKFGIMNRVHGAFLLASYGKPSIIIGSDSRARMAETIGLRHYFVNDVTCEILIDEYKYLKKGADNFYDRFKLIKEKAYEDYMKVLSVL